MIREQSVTLDAATLRMTAGPRNGHPTVFLHGVGRRSQDFGPLLSAFGPRGYVVAVDHRGHGGSSRASSYRVTDYVRDAIGLVSRLEEPAMLIGHSLGALVALGVALEIPTKVRGIVLEDPPSANFFADLERTPYAATFRAMQRLAGDPRGAQTIARELADVTLPDGSRLGERRDAAALRFLARGLADLDPAVFTPILERRWFDGFDPLTIASSVKCPALLLCGETDLGGMLPRADADALAAALSDAVRVNVPGVGHLIHGTRPDVFVSTVVNFLDSL